MEADTPIAGSLYLPSNSQSLQGSFQQSTPIDKSRSTLNKFLISRDLSPIRSSLQIPWSEASERTKRYYVKKAGETVAASLEVIAGEDSGILCHNLVSSKAISQRFPSEADGEKNVASALLEPLTECCNSATQWETRRQILSIMADKISFESLQRYIPNLTPYRFKIAKQYILMHGRGSPLLKTVQKRMCARPEMVDHFISFITSQHVVQDLPFGQKKLTLSTGEVLLVQNVIRNLVLW